MLYYHRLATNIRVDVTAGDVLIKRYGSARIGPMTVKARSTTVKPQGVTPPESDTVAGATVKREPPVAPTPEDDFSMDSILKKIRVILNETEEDIPSIAAKIASISNQDVALPIVIGRDRLSLRDAAAAISGSTLGKLYLRYEELLRTTLLPEGGFQTKEQAQAGSRLSSTYRNLRKRQIAAGIEPAPKDERVTKADRLREAYYRKAKPERATPRRGRAVKGSEPT